MIKDIKIVSFQLILLVTLLATLNIQNIYANKTQTPKYWKCYFKSGGTWEFGMAPDICDVDPFIDPIYVKQIYKDYIFFDSTNRQTEISRHANYIYSLIVQTSIFYIKNRKPNVSQNELNAWVQAILAMAHQETIWSHYRIPKSNRVQMVRGDYGHGHGIYQVDDRWHFSKVSTGRAADLVQNMIIGLEEFYMDWQQAAKARCVKSDDNYISQTRAAYSAYNGGLGSLCRWTNSKANFARNDVGFLQKFKSKSWRGIITNYEIKPSIDVKCLINGNENCNATVESNPMIVSTNNNVKDVKDTLDNNADQSSSISEKSDNAQNYSGKIYQTRDKNICVWDDKIKSFNCIYSIKDTSCLVMKYFDDFKNIGSSTLIHKLSDKFNYSNHKFLFFDRHQLCSSAVNGLIRIGSNIQTLKSINARTSPTGEVLGTIPKNTTLQILDFVVRFNLNQDRHYRVSYKGKVVYIYAGSLSTYNEWAIPTNKRASIEVVAHANDYIKSISDNSLKVYSSINSNGNEIDSLQTNDIVLVKDIIIHGDNNSIFYEISMNNTKGYIYSGNLLPDVSVDDFTKPITGNTDSQASSTSILTNSNYNRREGRLNQGEYYKYVYSCRSITECDKEFTIMGTFFNSKTFDILDEKDDWYHIQYGEKRGWIEQKYVTIVR